MGCLIYEKESGRLCRFPEVLFDSMFASISFKLCALGSKWCFCLQFASVRKWFDVKSFLFSENLVQLVLCENI